MLQLDKIQKTSVPFPHFWSDEVLPPDTYGKLQKELSGKDLWAGLPDAFQGGRQRLNTAEPKFREFIRANPTWRAFDSYLHSDSFVREYLNVYRDDIASLAPKFPIDDFRVVPNPRSRPKPGRVSRLLDHIISSKGRRNVYIDCDISSSGAGYWNDPHTDKNIRIAVLLIHLCDQEEEGITGGQLQLFRPRPGVDFKEVSPAKERFPPVDKLEPFAEFGLRHNRGISFLATNNSFHGAKMIEAAMGRRRFMYISVSSRYPYFW